MKRKTELNVVDFRRYRAQELFEEGALMERNGEVEKAIRRYIASAELDHGYARGLIAAGLLYDQLDDLEHAKQCFLDAIRIGKEPLAYYCLAFTNEKEGDLDSALENYRISVERIPDFTEGLIGMGDVHLRRKEFQKAAKSYERALYTDPLNLLIHVKRNSIKRYREFKDPFPQGDPPAPKVQVYAERGAINLGIDYDDGMDIPRYFFYNFSYHSLCVVIKRFHSFYLSCGWEFTKVISCDDMSVPLAIAMAEIFGIAISSGNDLFPRDRVLLVQGVGDRNQPVNNLINSLMQKQIQFMTFFFAVYPGVFFNLEPNIIGVYARTSLPWYRVEEFSRYQVKESGTEELGLSLDDVYIDEREPEKVADDILEEFEYAEAEENYQDQIDWYLEEHVDLNFDVMI